MKYLQIAAGFMLPEYFSGDISDALELMIQYHRSHPERPEKLVKKEYEQLPVKEFQQKVFSNLWNAGPNGPKLAGFCTCVEYDKKTKKWNKIAGV